MNRPAPSDAAAIFSSLRSKARAEHGGNTQGLLVVYATESFLRRLTLSPYADRLILKGGMLMAANEIRQMTKDGDLSARGIDNDPGSVARVVSSILRLTPIPPDGIDFDAENIRVAAMQEGASYHGVRCRTTARLDQAEIPLSLDISFGEAGSFEPLTIDSVAGHSSITVGAYPLTLNLAEKAVTAMQRGRTNTRDRDFADLWVASSIHEVVAAELRQHLAMVSKHRGQALVPFSQATQQLPDRQLSYAAMVERMSYLAPPPERWVDVLAGVEEFLDPLIADTDAKLSHWSPIRRRWSS